MSDEFDRLIYEAILEHQYNDMKEIIDALLARAEKAEADNVELHKIVERLIEAGNAMDAQLEAEFGQDGIWAALIAECKEWKEGNNE